MVVAQTSPLDPCHLRRMPLMEGEEEIAPGIYLTRNTDIKANKKTNSTNCIDEKCLKNDFGRVRESFGPNNTENIGFLKDQIDRIVNSNQKLEYSNTEMLKEDTVDQIIIDAVRGNILFIKRQNESLIQLRAQCQLLANTLNVTLDKLYLPITNPVDANGTISATESDCEDQGVYL